MSGLFEVDVIIWAIHEKLKGHLRNQNQPESCIVECYIYEDAVKFCNEYLSNVEA